jgi:hypothetical protein
MSLTEACEPADVSLPSLPANKILKDSDNTEPRSLCCYNPKRERAEIFTIKFNFLNQAYLTKVMKVKYGSDHAIYKVALCSRLSAGSSICWLEHLPGGWIMLLGNDMDQGAKKAIIAAIECQEDLTLDHRY